MLVSALLAGTRGPAGGREDQVGMRGRARNPTPETKGTRASEPRDGKQQLRLV